MAANVERADLYEHVAGELENDVTGGRDVEGRARTYTGEEGAAREDWRGKKGGDVIGGFRTTWTEM